MTSIQPELWVDNPRDALAFYAAAFGATVLHRVGEGDDIVAQLGVGEAAQCRRPVVGECAVSGDRGAGHVRCRHAPHLVGRDGQLLC